MELIPAIDVLDGAAVRLLRGDYGDVTVYHEDAVDAAERWVAAGATRIHVVDLDAARGRARDLVTIRRLSRVVPVLQVGGGVRTARDALETLECGASRVVIGSSIVSPSDDDRSIVAVVGGEHVIAALDVRDGRAVGSGWLDGGVPLADAVDRVLHIGISSALVTGIDRDGTMDGPDVEVLGLVRARAPALHLIASGGVATGSDVLSLASSSIRIDATIVGRALYEGRIELAGTLRRLASLDRAARR